MPSRALQTRDDLSPMFDELIDLTVQQRDTLKERYRFLLAEYRRRCCVYSFLFYSLRMTMTVGSLVVPALLSLKAGPENDERLYWFTWAVSLAVTTANGLTTLFKLDKRFFMLHAVAEKLRSETWQYLALSGRYSGHFGGYKPTHKNQYVYYMSQVEKIRMKHIDEEFIRQAEMVDPRKQLQQAQAAANAEEDSLPGPGPIAKKQSRVALRDENAIPTPPNPTDLTTGPPTVPPSTRPPARRVSSSSIGSSDAIALDITESQNATAVPSPAHTVSLQRPGGAVQAQGAERDSLLSSASKV